MHGEPYQNLLDVQVVDRFVPYKILLWHITSPIKLFFDRIREPYQIIIFFDRTREPYQNILLGHLIMFYAIPVFVSLW